MEKVPYSKYTKQLRLEVLRLATEGGLSSGEVSARISLPKFTLETRVQAFRAGVRTEAHGLKAMVRDDLDCRFFCGGIHLLLDNFDSTKG